MAHCTLALLMTSFFLVIAQDVIDEQVELLGVKLIRYGNMVNAVSENVFFKNKDSAKCPGSLDKMGKFKCYEMSSICSCFSPTTTEVNWFTARAFCEYYGMILVRTPLTFDGHSLPRDWRGVHFWTSAQDFSLRWHWNCDNNIKCIVGKPAKQPQKMQQKDGHIASCLSVTWTSDASFQSSLDDCLSDKRAFICAKYLPSDKC